MPKPQTIATGLILLLLGFGLGRVLPGGGEAPLYGPQAGTEAADSRASAEVVPDDENDRAIREALALPDGFDRLIALAEFLRDADASAVPATVKAVKSTDDIVRAAEIDVLVRFWARHEPDKATRWALMAPLAYRAVAIGPSMQAWAMKDPISAAAAARTGSIDQGTATQVAQISLIRGWFASGKPGLLEHIGAMGPGVDQLRALAAFSRELVEQRGTDVAIEWALSLPDEPMAYKRDVVRQLSTAVAAADLQAALAFCEIVCAEPFGDGVRKRIAQQWALEDGPAALQWLSEAPPSQDRDLAVRVAFDTWRRNDQDTAFEWLASFGIEGVEPWLRPAVAIYAKLLSATDPAASMAWVELIPNDAEREFTMVRVARRWRAQDEAAAEAWVQQSPLPEPLREAARTTVIDAPIPQPQLIE